MVYTCKCADGPIKGQEFQDHGLAVVVEIPYRGQIFTYRLISVLDHGCVYRFHGLSDKRDGSSFFALRESRP